MLDGSPGASLFTYHLEQTYLEESLDLIEQSVERHIQLTRYFRCGAVLAGKRRKDFESSGLEP